MLFSNSWPVLASHNRNHPDLTCFGPFILGWKSHEGHPFSRQFINHPPDLFDHKDIVAKQRLVTVKGKKPLGIDPGHDFVCPYVRAIGPFLAGDAERVVRGRAIRTHSGDLFLYQPVDATLIKTRVAKHKLLVVIKKLVPPRIQNDPIALLNLGRSLGQVLGRDDAPCVAL